MCVCSTSRFAAGWTDFGLGSTAVSRVIAATARTNAGRSASRCVMRNDAVCSPGANWAAIRAK